MSQATSSADFQQAMAQMALQQAKQAYAARQPGEALQLCARAIELAPRFLPPRHLLGMLHTEMGRPDLAADAFEAALAVDGAQPAVRCALAHVRLQLGQAPEAVAALRQALAQAPQDLGVQNRLAMALKEQGEEAEALQILQLAVGDSIGPTTELVQILVNLGNLLFKLDRGPEALDAYRRALQIIADMPGANAMQAVALTNRARLLAETGDLAAALADSQQALTLQPQHVGALQRRAEVLADLGQLDTAITDARQAVALAPHSEDSHNALVSLLVRASGPHSDTGHGPDQTADTQALLAAETGYANLLATRFAHAPDGPAVTLMRGRGWPTFRLKHDLQQAEHLLASGDQVPGLAAFVDAAQPLWAAVQDLPQAERPGFVHPSAAQLQAMLPYLRTPWRHRSDGFAGPCLNPDQDWAQVQAAYLARQPELVVIDQFLAPAALAWLRTYCLRSRVWLREYRGKYLGAFAVGGFLSPVHLQLAHELRRAMPLVFGGLELMQLWGFKYDAQLGTGINMHADFARVNLNFWITPDEHNLDPEHGGLVVYDAPAPADWSFHQYNAGGPAIQAFLKSHNAQPVRVPHRANRAVLFNSALFHETDRIHFADTYEGRRINMTYLFGQQLR